MEVIYTLIPGMILLGLLFIGVMFWAIRKGQYEDLEGDGSRILMDDDDDPMLPHNQAQADEKKTSQENDERTMPN